MKIDVSPVLVVKLDRPFLHSMIDLAAVAGKGDSPTTETERRFLDMIQRWAWDRPERPSLEKVRESHPLYQEIPSHVCRALGE